MQANLGNLDSTGLFFARAASGFEESLVPKRAWQIHTSPSLGCTMRVGKMSRAKLPVNIDFEYRHFG